MVAVPSVPVGRVPVPISIGIHVEDEETQGIVKIYKHLSLAGAAVVIGHLTKTS